LFPNAKTFEGRKFDNEYLHTRRVKLQAFVDSIIAQKDLHNDEILIKWLGLQDPEDPRMSEIFDLAFINTKWRLWIWRRIPYDEEEQAISKLVIEEISREMFGNMLSGLPNVTQIRNAAMMALYKTISATVGPAVSIAWKGLREATKPLKPKISDIIDTGIEKLLDAEREIKTTMKKGIEEGLTPICEQLTPVLRSLAERGVEPALLVLKELYPYFQAISNQFDMIVTSGDPKQVEEIEKLIKNAREEAQAKVDGVLQKAIEGAVGDLSKHVTLDALSSLFHPIQKLVNLINNAFDLFLNPVPHVRCIQTMCEYRAKLEELSPKDPNFREKVEDILDQEESWLMWRRWWVYWDYRWKAWSIYYFSWGMRELSTVAKVLRETSFEYAIVQKKWIKKWSFRFGDHLHERAKTATDETWSATVRECFGIGYREANDFLKKRAYHIFTNLVREFFYAAIGVKVQAEIMKLLALALEEASKMIPSPIDEILDINTITEEAVEEALKEQITSQVNECFIEPYVAAWKDLSF